MAFLETLKGLSIFLNILKGLVGIDRQTNEDQRKLITTLGEAARSTQDAIRKLRNGEDTIADLETTIAKKWIAASALLKSEDKNLAIRLYGKGQAWINAKDWSEEDFERAMANIKAVDNYVKQIISS